MPFVLNNQAWERIMKNFDAIRIGWFQRGPALVRCTRKGPFTSWHVQVTVGRIHEAGHTEHSRNVVDGPVVLTDQRELIDCTEYNRGRALINRVIGQQKRKGHA